MLNDGYGRVKQDKIGVMGQFRLCANLSVIATGASGANDRRVVRLLATLTLTMTGLCHPELVEGAASLRSSL